MPTSFRSEVIEAPAKRADELVEAMVETLEGEFPEVAS